MVKLIYSPITSLDGYVADESGNFDWAAPDEEVHAFVNDLVRPVGTHLYGRRMYDVMRYWETDPRPPTSRSSHATSQRPGARRTRSSTRRRWPRHRAHGRGS
jgi:dihydrofolate reductase